MYSDLISIIIPVYNVKEYLQVCVESVLMQSYSNLEVILIDDGSTDGSAELVDQLSRNDKRIVVVHQDNQGLSGARNTGIDSSKGKYLFFLDSDDCISPEAIELLYTNLLKENADMAFCAYISFKDSIVDLKSLPKQSNAEIKYKYNVVSMNEIENICDGYNQDNIIKTGRAWLLEESSTSCADVVVAWGKLYKREVFSNIRYPIGRYHEDEYVTYKILYSCSKVVFVPYNLLFYRQRNNSIMAQRSIEKMEKKFHDAFDAYEEKINYFKSEDDLVVMNYYEVSKAFLMISYILNLSCRFEKDLIKTYKKMYNHYLFNDLNLIKKAIPFKKKVELYIFWISPFVFLLLRKLVYTTRK